MRKVKSLSPPVMDSQVLVRIEPIIYVHLDLSLRFHFSSKIENEEYRERIDRGKSDSQDFVDFLKLKLEDKRNNIHSMQQNIQTRHDANQLQQKSANVVHRERVEKLESTMVDLEFKIARKNQRIASLSSVMVLSTNRIHLHGGLQTKRSKFNAEVSEIKEEIAQVEIGHEQTIKDMERRFMKERLAAKDAAEAMLAEKKLMAEEVSLLEDKSILKLELGGVAASWHLLERTRKHSSARESTA